MFDESLSVLTIWSSLLTWLTPAVLFLVLNLVIGTIAFTSGSLSSSSPSSNPHAPLPLPRSPSSVLHRLRSLHLSRSDYLPPPSDSVILPDPDPLPSDLNNAPQDDPDSEEIQAPTMEEVFDRIQKGYSRSKSDGASTMAPKKLRKRIIQKAASDISTATGRFEAPPVQEVAEEEEGGDLVDGQAEDFINRFRQQLNLQRMESLYGATASN